MGKNYQMMLVRCVAFPTLRNCLKTKDIIVHSMPVFCQFSNRNQTRRCPNFMLVLCSQSLFRFADLGDDGLCRGGPDKGCGVIVSAIDVVVDRLD